MPGEQQRVRVRRWLLALSAGGAGVAGAYAATGRWTESLVAVVESFVVDATPGVVVTAAITTLGDYAQPSVGVFAVGVAVLTLAFPAGVGLALAARGDVGQWVAAALVGLSVVGVTAAGTGSAAAALGAGLAGGAVTALAARGATEGETPRSRRGFLRALGGGAAVLGGSVLLGDRRAPGSGGDGPAVDALPRGETDAADRLAAAAEKSLDVEGLPPLVSREPEFYEVDINTINPTVDPATWEFSVTGDVLRERTWTLPELSALPVDQRFATLRCVGDPLNGHKMDNALWTGVPADAVLDAARPAGTHVVLRAADGYYNEFPIEALRGGLFAYRMNGDPLPRKHGAPLRALVPGHWGEVNVKWLTEVEVRDHETQGYWEKRGWHGTGPVNTVAKLWTRAGPTDGRMRVGGHAYAGTRGVGGVEVSVDGGETWHDARLSERLAGTDVWRQWAHEWEPSTKRPTVVVRAIEDDGTVQPATRAEAFPNGATGWVSDELLV